MDNLEDTRTPFPFMKTRDGIVNEINDEFYTLTGYTQSEIAGKSVHEVLHKLLKATIPDNYFAEPVECLECFIFTKDSKARDVALSCFQLSDTEEKTYVFYDKTCSRLDEMFQYAQQISMRKECGLAIFSAGLVLLKANNAYIKYLVELNNKISDYIGSKLCDIIPGFTGSASERMWTDVINTGKSVYHDEYKCDYPKICTKYWNFSLVPVYAGEKIKYIFVQVSDSTDSVLNKQLVEEQNKTIKEQKERLEAIIENMSDVLYVFDNKGMIIVENKVSRENIKLSGFKNIESLKREFQFIDEDGNLIPDDELKVVNIFKGEKVKDLKIKARYKDEELYLSLSGTSICDNSGNPGMTIICGRNITDSVKQEEMILKAEQEKIEALKKAIEMKDEFISLISHEFKTPLTVINSAVQAIEILYNDELPGKVKDYLSKIRQNSYRQMRLVNNLLDITRYNAGRMKIDMTNKDIVFVTRSITESVKIYAQEKGTRLLFASTMVRKVIGMDEEKYERIILNLLANAVKFTPRGREIAVKLSQITLKGNAMVRISVSDKGIGIPADKQELIFERFGQVDNSLSRQAEGTGIGLSLVKKLVESMNGIISLESGVGEGSTFSILLPAKKVKKSKEETVRNPELLNELSDSRLVQAIAVEFSDIYI